MTRRKPVPTLKTARLILRPLDETDAARLAEMGGDWDVASMTARMPYPYTVAAAYQWIDELDEGEYAFGIDVKESGELIGVTGFSLSADRRSAEVGYWLGRDFWGRGYATEAAETVIGFCFQRMRVMRITCGHFSDNPASGRVIEKLGFAPIGVSDWWCEARRLETPAMRYELVRPPAWPLRLLPMAWRQAG